MMRKISSLLWICGLLLAACRRPPLAPALSSVTPSAPPLSAPSNPNSPTNTAPPTPEDRRSPTGTAHASQSPKLDGPLSALTVASFSGPAAMQAQAAMQDMQLTAGQVQVQVFCAPESRDTVSQTMAALGGSVTGELRNDYGEWVLQGWLPVEALTALASNVLVYQIRQPAEAILLEDASAGWVTTAGLAALGGDLWHAAGITGAGVRVGVIDGGFRGYGWLLGSDLPATVAARNFVDGETLAQVDGGTIHGTACAEVIYDVAPNAELYLAKIATDVDLAEAVAWLRDEVHVNIISTSLGWYNMTPGDGSGFFAELVRQTRAAGILWVTAAGNDRLSHWGGDFNDSNGSGYHDFAPTSEINYVEKTLPGRQVFAVYARWDDWQSVTQDYDLTLWGYSAATQRWEKLTGSYNEQAGVRGQRPIEYATVLTSDAYTAYGFSLSRHRATRAVHFEVFTPKLYPLTYGTPERSLANLADAPDALTVAALHSAAPHAYEFYSAEGPTNGPGGVAVDGGDKPDLAGYANVATRSYGATLFNGTSAATPHVAGAAALLWNAYAPSAGSQTAEQVRAELLQRAVDVETSGVDRQTGYGRLALGAPPGGPTFMPLPELLLAAGAEQSVDLWAYVSDPRYPLEQLLFTLAAAPDPEVGARIEANRYLRIAPAATWTGAAAVDVRVSNPLGQGAASQMRVQVQRLTTHVYLPLVLVGMP